MTRTNKNNIDNNNKVYQPEQKYNKICNKYIKQSKKGILILIKNTLYSLTIYSGN